MKSKSQPAKIRRLLDPVSLVFKSSWALLVCWLVLAQAGYAAAPGSVVAWGNSGQGQTTVPAGLSGVATIAAGYAYTVVLKSDGTVVAWGENSYGQTTVPGGLSGVTAIAGGGFHALALKSNGTVAGWGFNGQGQTTVPVGLSGVTAIAAGYYHSVALRNDRTVVAWGYNSDGQTTVPAGLSGVAAIAGGQYHTVALKSDGTVVAWGFNGQGQTTVPAGLSGVAAIAAGMNHTAALKSDGTVVAWGWNVSGQTTVPAGLSGVTAISAGYGHTVALKSDGTVVAWGRNVEGQTTIPTGLSVATAIAAGGQHTLIIAGSPPAITSQPTNQTAVAGATLMLNVTASGFNPLTYQWRRDGTNLAGATSSALVLNAAQPGDSGNYTVVVTNPLGAATSATATLNILPLGAAPNRVLTLDGGGDFVTIPSAADLQSPDTFTLEAWIFPSAFGTNTSGQFLNKGDGQSVASVRSYEVTWTPDRRIVLQVFLNTTTWAAIATPAEQDRWVHVAVTYDSGAGRLNLFTNGLLAASTTRDASGQVSLAGQRIRQTTLPLVFGQLPGNGNSYVNGQMDEVRIWSRVRSPDEIAGAMFCHLAGNEPGLAGYWTFDDGTATDRTGHGHHGVFSGNPTTPVLLGAEPLHTTNQAPCLTSLPQSLTVGIGQNASFAVTAVAGTNTGPFNFQWRKNGAAIPGANAASYVISGVQPGAGGNYEVIVSNIFGSVTSAPPAVLTVNATADSKVVAWGDNAFGQTNLPPSLTGVTAIAAGGYHNVALRTNGMVVAWGAGTTSAGGTLLGPVSAGTENEFGQSIVPAGLSGVSAISAGGYHTVVLKSNAAVVAWGDSSFGQTNIPVGLSGVTAVAAGAFHSVALKGDGTVVAWGAGRTNVGAFPNSGQSIVPAGLSGVTAIAAGTLHTVALRSDGTVVVWGANSDGQTIIPAGLVGVANIAAGAYHTVALKSDSTVVAWGANFFSQTTTPIGLSGVRAIAAGFGHTVALKFDGTVVAWGAGMTSTTNDFDRRQSLVPVGLSGVVAIAAGHSHTLALIGGSPTLTTFPMGNSVSVVWPASATGYRLESVLNLASPALWSAESGSLQTNGGNISFVVPRSGAPKFFRLVKP